MSVISQTQTSNAKHKMTSLEKYDTRIICFATRPHVFGMHTGLTFERRFGR